MEIKSTLTNRSGEVLDVIYRDIDNESELEERRVSVVHAYCFYKDKLVVVYSESKGYWTPPGGGVEKGEAIEGAVYREVKEETNMRVFRQRLIGYQDIYQKDKVESQTRSVCLVEPYGEFVADPDGDVTEIKLIEPSEYKKYFDWGQIGDRIFERALELKKQLKL